MPVLEQRPSFLFKFLDVARFVAFPQYEASLPKHQDLTGKKVYLIHLNTPYKHAKHYLGFSEKLPGRVQQHRRGNGARFMEVIAKQGISWHVSRVWDGDRELEAALKTGNNSGRLCPTCLQEKVYERTFSVQVKIRPDGSRQRLPSRRGGLRQPSLWEEEP